MRSKLGLGVAAVIALVGASVAGAATFASSDADGRSSGAVIRLVAKEVSSGFLDLGEADYSQGDQIPFTNDLFSDGKMVGEDGGWCVVTRITPRGAVTFQCLGVNDLPEGQIAVQGLVTYGPGEEIKGEPYHFAITGGTGAYKGARGTVRIEEVTAERLRLTFRLGG